MCALSLRQGVTEITCLQELDEREVTASLTSRQSHKATSWKHTKLQESKTLPEQKVESVLAFGVGWPEKSRRVDTRRGSTWLDCLWKASLAALGFQRQEEFY